MMQTLIFEVGHRAKLANAKLNQTTRTLRSMATLVEASQGFMLWDLPSDSVGLCRIMSDQDGFASEDLELVPWQCNGTTMAMPWCCQGTSMALPAWCHGTTIWLPWRCHGSSMAVPWHCCGDAKTVKQQKVILTIFTPSFHE